MNRYNVLVLGSGFSGLGISLALARKGYSVLILEQEESPGGLLKDVCRGMGRLQPLLDLIQKHEKIKLLTQAKIQSIDGFYPRFTVHWRQKSSLFSSEISHVVFATGLSMQFPKLLYPEGSKPGVLLLPDLETRVCGENWSEFQQKRILFICGYQKLPSPYSIQLTLDRCIKLKEAGAQSMAVLPDILLESADTEALFKTARQKGVLIFRSPQPPAVSGNSPEFNFEIVDSVLSSEEGSAIVHGTADLLVLEPDYLPRTLPEIFWSPHRPSVDVNGFYQPDNPNLGPVKSERKGIYYVGAITGFKSLESCREEVAIACSEIQVEHPENTPYAEVDEKKCVACLTCARICPHRAIRLDGTAHVAVESCDGCGLCAAECPARAITMVYPGKNPENIVFNRIPDHLPKWLVLYCCNGSSGPTWDRIQKDPELTSWNIHPVRVTCSGEISVSSLLEHFKKGAEAIMVAVCPVNSCDHIHGNKLAANRVIRLKKILASLDLNPGKIELVHIGHGMEMALKERIIEFCREHLSSEETVEGQA